MCAALMSAKRARRLEAVDLGWLQEHLCERAIPGLVNHIAKLDISLMAGGAYRSRAGCLLGELPQKPLSGLGSEGWERARIVKAVAGLLPCWLWYPVYGPCQGPGEILVEDLEGCCEA